MGDPLTLGMAGHIDHGKTALVRALTGVDTDRLPEERARGISISLGYAALRLPSGRQLSVVDVPGHERLVRTMVAGASGIDIYLMVIAADDGVMPQTLEHAEVFSALGVDRGVVAVTKCDRADPATAIAEARDLLPGALRVVPCSSVTGAGLAALADALEDLSAATPSRARAPGPTVLHVDRSFSIKGIGSVVTGTLWSGTVRIGDRLALMPGGQITRVRGLHVHDVPVGSARAGQRVAVNLAGVGAREAQRGDAIATPGALGSSTVLDCTLGLRDDVRHGEQVQVHHGTREVPARLACLGDGLWQLRLQRPVLAVDGDRIVVRRIAPPDTLGGGTVLDASASKHGRRPDILTRLAAIRDGSPIPAHVARRERATPVDDFATTHGRPASAHDAALLDRVQQQLRDAGVNLVNRAQLDAPALAVLCANGGAVRISRTLYAAPDVAASVGCEIVALLSARGAMSLAEVRDALGISRRSAQAFLEHLDTQRVTRRLPDNRRILRTRRSTNARQQP